MAFEHFKTQVLLLHSEQSALDDFSAGFNDKYSVHCATSGTEALNTLGDTPIHIIVSAQDLPGMSGLDALREARKRSPDTIGILLAGRDEEDGLEALVGDQEVFQIVRGSITAEALLKLVESATQRMRLLALADSANDQAANPDEPVTEHIVMETSEHGSSIISDGTGRMPVLQPHKIEISPDAGSRNVDVLVMTKDEEFLATIKDSARGLHNVHHAITPTQAENYVRDNTVGVLVTDAAMVGTTIEATTQKLRQERPRMVAIVAGRRDDGEMLMDLINRGHVYRFLLKPVSPGRARLAIEASVKHHLEAPDSAFKPKPQTARLAVKTKALPKPKPIAKPKPVAKKKPIEKPKPVAKKKPVAKPGPVARKKPAAKEKPIAKKEPKLAPLPEPIPVLMPEIKARPKPKPKLAPPPESKKKEKTADRIEPTISASPIDDILDEVFDDKTGLKETASGIAESVGKTLSSAGSLAEGAQSAVQASGKAAADAIGSALAPIRKPQTLRIAGGAIAAIAVAGWVFSSWDSTPADVAPAPADAIPTVAESSVTIAPPVREAEVEPDPQPLPELPAYQALLDDARAARDAGNFIEPAGDNAVELYLMVLEEAQGDSLISAELDDVVSQVLSMAETAILEQNAENANNSLSMVRLADPDNPRLTFLNAQLTQLELRTLVDEARVAIRDGKFEDAGRLISEARSLAGIESVELNLVSQELSAARNQQKVEEMLATANAQLEAGNLISPSRENARYYFVLALTKDPGNQAAQQGLTIVASKLSLQARDAIDNGRFDDARALLGDAQTLDPSNSELAASTQALQTALEAKAEAEQQAEAARLAELEHQAELARQAEAARLAELEHQAELARQAEVARQEELRKQAEIERQAAIERQAELDRQAEAARLAEIEKQAEAGRQAAAREAQREAQRLASEKNAAAAATASTLGVAGSAVKEASSSSTPGPAKPRNNSSNAAPVVQTPPPAAPKPTAVAGATTFAIDNAANGSTSGTSSQAAVPTFSRQSFPSGNNAVDSRSNGNSNDSAADSTIPISQLTRTNYVAPVYPRSAQRRNVTGAVEVSFTVSTIGTVTDISILRAEPEDTFNQAAMNAVAEWLFQPVIENGVAVEKRTAVRLAFDLQ